MKMSTLAVLVAAFVLTGCASRLVVYPGAKDIKDIRGIRVQAPVSYIVTKEITTENCGTRSEDEIIHLARGETYEINFTPALLAKSEFSISFNDQGVLTQVSFNSTPQVPETLRAIGELTEKVSSAILLKAKPEEDCGRVLRVRIIGVKKLKIDE